MGLASNSLKLKKVGLVINPKPSARIYKEERLKIRHRKQKKRLRFPRVMGPKAARPNEVWSIDFVHDWLMTNRELKILTVIDDFTKKSTGIFVGHALTELQVADFFRAMIQLPNRIRSDNGPEFDSSAFAAFAEEFGIEQEFITPGKRDENAYIQSFNSKFRDECLNQHVFRNLEDAKIKIEDWRKNYNEEHLHSSLRMMTPNEFAENRKKCYLTNAP